MQNLPKNWKDLPCPQKRQCCIHEHPLLNTHITVYLNISNEKWWNVRIPGKNGGMQKFYKWGDTH